MKWYLTQLVYQILNDSSKSQYDEQIRLVSAHDRQEALEKAENLGKANEDAFRNIKGKVVTWKLTGTSVFGELQMINDGMVLYSSTHENQTPESLLKHSLNMDAFSQQSIIIE